MKVNKIIKSTVEEELKITGATLLSIEEAEILTEKERKYTSQWWLRSHGTFSYYATLVHDDGYISSIGYHVDNNYTCVRPALTINNLKSSNLEIGDIFEIDGYEFKIISKNLAWMYKQDIGCYAFNEDYGKGNNYITSNVKKFVDKWFRILMFNNSEER